MSLKLGNTAINKIYLGSTEVKKLYLGTNLILDNGTIDTVVTIDTTSTSSTWTPQSIINSGGALTWEVTGGVVIAPQVIDTPILNLSSNTGTANITITSSTGFVGFTEMQLDQLSITSTDITEAVELTKIDYWQNTIGTIDLTQNVDLETIWLQDTGLTAFDLSLNTLAKFVSLDFNNSLNTTALDKIVNDLAANGVLNGSIKLSGNSGLPLTSASDTSYDTLETNGWTIDVAKSTPVDTEDPVIGTLSYANLADTTVELSCTATDNTAVVSFDIYLDSILDRNVLGSSLSSYEFDGLTAETNYDIFVVAKDAADNESLASNIINFTTDATVTTDGLRPVLSNFHIKDGIDTKLYFDSSEVITASTGVNGYTGFTITDKVISQITINGTSLTDHYFTVTVAFDHYSNNTIRYEVGSDIVDSESNALYNFDLQYITNNIVEPTASNKYVTVAGAGIGDGSLGNEWTLTEACAQATAGDNVNVAAGDYGSGNFVVSNSGTLADPIIFEGYDSVIGDSPSLTNAVDLVFSASTMPYIHTTGNSGDGFSLGGNDYVIVKNIQVEGYNNDILFGSGATYCKMDNVYARGTGSTGYCLHGHYTNLKGCRVTNSYASDASGHGIRMAGQLNLIDDLYVSSNGNNSMDYYVSIYGTDSGNGVGESIVRNLTLIRDPLDSHYGHGISLRGSNRNLHYTLVENVYSEAIGSAATELRSPDVQYCVLRNIEVDNKNLTSGTFNAMRVTSAQNNIIDGLVAYDCEYFIRFMGSDEEQSQIDAVDAGNNNLFKNCVMYNKSTSNSNWAIVREETDGDSGQDRVPNNNKFVNCTFDNITYSISMGNASRGQGNEFINCIFNNIDIESQSFSNDWAYSYSDFYTSFPTPSGTGNISVKPDFTDLANNDYSLSSITSSLIYEGGTDTGYYYDITERESITPFSMGAYYKNSADIFPTVYVSLSGDNSDGLTEATAWNNLVSVENDAVNWVAGEVIAFRKGDTFNDNFYVSSHPSGASGNEITYTSYGSGNKPIINTHEEQTGLTWTDEGSNIWSTPTSTGRRLFKNGSELLKAESLVDLQTNAVAYGLGYFNDGVDIYVYSTTDPTTDSFSWSLSTYTFKIDNCDYITIDGLDIRGGNNSAYYVESTNNDNLTIKNCNIGWNSGNGIILTGDTQDNFIIDNNTLDSNFLVDESGLPEGSEYDRGCLDGCDVRDNSDGGQVSNNTLKNWGHSGIGSNPSVITAKVTNLKVYGNDVSSPDILYGRGFGFTTYFEDGEIYNNKFHNTSNNNQLGGSRNHFHHNIIDGVIETPLKADRVGHGIQIANTNDVQIVDNIIENNVVMNTESEGINIYSINTTHPTGEVTGNIIRNNIIYNCGTVRSNVGIQFHEDQAGQSIYDNLVYNNLVYSDATTLTCRYQWAGTIYNTTNFNAQNVDISGNIGGDPLIESGYGIDDASPAVNAGITGLSTTDYFGNTIPYLTTDTDIGIEETTVT